MKNYKTIVTDNISSEGKRINWVDATVRARSRENGGLKKKKK